MTTEQLTEAFRAANREGCAALVCYVMAGDPTLEATEELLRVVDDAGAGVLELGVPFSDPIADGPVLQAAATRALLGHTTLLKTLDLAARLRGKLRAPLVAMGYLNPFLNLGLERFAREASAAGLSGAIVPDLPPEEAGELRTALAAHDLSLIPLVAPTTEGERLKRIAREATGFIYTVSVTGVTGARAKFPEELSARLAELRALARVPVAVGFGVARPEQARALARLADGVVVGSALVQLHAAQGARAVGHFVRALCEAMRKS